MKNICFLLFCAIIFTNCTFTFNDKMYVSDKALGILDHPQEVAKVLIIHGMGTRTECYADPMVKGLVRELNLKKKPEQSKRIKLTQQKNSSVLVEEYKVKNKKKAGINRIQIYTVHWSNINKPLKTAIYRHDVDERRSKIAHNVKYQLFVDGLSDVSYYFNIPSQRNAIQQTVIETLRLMVAEDPFARSERNLGYCSPDELEKLHLISSSFGSTIVLDVLERIQTEGCGDSRVDNLLRRLDLTFYMISNQLPLLNLSEKSEFGNFTLFEHLETFVYNGNQASLICFNDPNDIMGFRIPIELMPKEYPISAVNVSVRNSKFYPVWKIDKPHWDAMKNSRIHEFIANGIETTDKSVKVNGQSYSGGTLKKSVFYLWQFSPEQAAKVKPLPDCKE